MSNNNTVEENKVKFFTEKNCKGECVEYREGCTIWFKKGDKYNDKFLSCIVGSKVKVSLWEHNEIGDEKMKMMMMMDNTTNTTGTTNILTLSCGKYQFLKSGTVNNDLSSIGGISKIEVISSEYEYVVNIKYMNKVTPDDKIIYEMILTPPHQNKPITLIPSSIEKYVQVPIPLLNQPDSDYRFQITIRKLELIPSSSSSSSSSSSVTPPPPSNPPICTGSINFKWSTPSNLGLITIKKIEGFPIEKLSIKQDDNTSFTFTLIKL